jgi:hypothetical protein
MTALQPISTAPKDKTIIVTGGWYEHPTTGQRQDYLPAYVAWNDLEQAWIMQDDYKRVYNEPKQWAPT